MPPRLAKAAGTSPKLKIQGRTNFQIFQGFGVMIQLLVYAPSLPLPPTLNQTVTGMPVHAPCIVTVQKLSLSSLYLHAKDKK